MELQYRTEAYIRKAIRQASIYETAPGVWIASLASLGLKVTRASEEEAEEALLIQITARVLGARQGGFVLPPIDGVDLDVEDPATSAPPGAGSERQPAFGIYATPHFEALALTPRESLMVAEALANPPAPTPYLTDAAREYREFMGY